MQSLWLIFQLIFCLLLGFAVAKKLPSAVVKVCFQFLPWFSYLLLIAIAFEFAAVLEQIPSPLNIISSSISIAFCTTLGAFIASFLLFKWAGVTRQSGTISLSLLLHSLKNIVIALAALLFGYGLFVLCQFFALDITISSWYLLLIFIFVIGIDLAYSPLDRSWLNLKILLVPIGCILGSIIAVLLYAQLNQQFTLNELLLLSQGYGFYSMSGIVITELRGAELGSITLMNDLFREIFAILLMYCIGWRYPRAAIASAGATAMDATLPMVKQACGNDFIPHAMVSGCILSVLAPVAVSILAVI